MSIKAMAAWRAARAVELMTAGHTYDEIARAVGYANRGTAYRVVQKALADRLTEDVEELRAVEVARLDALQAGLWSKAMDGDARAALTVVRVIEQRSRLLGLHGPQAAGSSGPMTLVVDTGGGNAGEATPTPRR